MLQSMEDGTRSAQSLSFDQFSERLHSVKHDTANVVRPMAELSTQDPRDDDHDISEFGVSRMSRRFSVSIGPEDTGALSTTSVAMDMFVELLVESGLKGPVYLVAQRNKIGEGGQFIVWKQEAIISAHSKSLIAAKRLKLPGSAESPMKLGDLKAQKHLYHIYLEIKALTNTRLRRHPNIVRLLAWSQEVVDWRRYPVFCFELATDDLQVFLQTETRPTKLMEALSRDIAAGLDVIHECGICHGDLKPANVLLFTEGSRTVAKLADFGFSQDSETVSVFGGTAGWQAPEVKRNLKQDIDPRSADIFSYGLVVWSIFLLQGLAPTWSLDELTDHPINTAVERCNPVDEHERSLYMRLRDSVVQLTRSNPADRPKRAQDIPLFTDYQIPRAIDAAKVTDESDTSTESDRSKFSWEPDRIPSDLVSSLCEQFRGLNLTQRTMSNKVLFSLFLAQTLLPSTDVRHRSTTLPLLRLCAEQDYAPAKSLIECSHSYFGVELPEYHQAKVDVYLKDAVLTGSVQARKRLRMRDAATFRSSLDAFRMAGGYLTQYADIPFVPVPGSAASESTTIDGRKFFGHIHFLCAHGTADALGALLRQSTDALESFTVGGETPLQIACMRGDVSILLTLLLWKANPAQKHKWCEISCLHWLFNFDDDIQDVVAKLLLDNGAPLNSLATGIPFRHFPFVLPTGSPLHWSVALECHRTISVLLENGADPLLRNGADQYVLDTRFRSLGEFHGIVEEEYSLSDIPVQGLSCLDLAAIQRDGFIFEWLAKNDRHVDINSTDELGFTAVHHLAARPTQQTRWWAPFDHRVFRQPAGKENLKRTLRSMLALGANLGTLSKVDADNRITDYTALMLAADLCDIDLVEALIECGAQVDQENLQGDTALLNVSRHHLQDEEAYLSCTKTLVAFGADVNHRNLRGYSALQKAALTNMPKVVDFLLSEGADFTERMAQLYTFQRDVNVLALLSQGSPLARGSYDEDVARLLDKYLLDSKDPGREDVIHRGNQNGETLLHGFAQRGMFESVRALLRCGAGVNTKRTNYRANYPDDPRGVRRKIVTCWQTTPLDDVLMRARKFRNDAPSANQYSPADYEAIAGRYEETARLLEEHEAVEAEIDTRHVLVDEDFWPSWDSL